jgi:AcrR family transcriptional regulator
MTRSNAKPGRPRGFDADRALDAALKVFWQKGYEGATMPELTAAMRINRPSLYAAFGDKQALFRKAMQRYQDGPAAYARAALTAPTARQVVELLLRGAIKQMGNRHNPRGCFAVQSALACSADAESVRKDLTACREASVKALRERFKRAKREGDLPRSADPAALARYVATVLHGMSVQAASGASASEMRRVAEMALRAWPS